MSQQTDTDHPEDDDEDSAIAKLYYARDLIDEALHDLNPDPPATDEQVTEDMVELCRSNPEFAAQILVTFRRRFRASAHEQLSRVLDLTDKQNEKLEIWLAARGIDGDADLDIFKIAKGKPKP